MADGVRIRLTGQKRLARAIEAIARIAPQCTADALNETALAMQHDAKTMVRVKTGNLRSSIHPIIARPQQGARMNAGIFTNVNYARHQEFGTRRMTAHPFMYPAFRRQRPLLIKRLTKRCGDDFVRIARRIAL